jgi:hypothetical protein
MKEMYEMYVRHCRHVKVATKDNVPKDRFKIDIKRFVQGPNEDKKYTIIPEVQAQFEAKFEFTEEDFLK